MAVERLSTLMTLVSPDICLGATVPPNIRVPTQDPISRFFKKIRMSLRATSMEALYLEEGQVLV